MEKIKTTVRIAGKDYTMSGYDSENYVRRVAMYVDRKISELGRVTRMSLQDVTVLTAVTTADELLKSQDENNRLRRELMEARQQMEEMQQVLSELKAAQAGEERA
jgi:cell division protein ZapA